MSSPDTHVFTDQDFEPRVLGSQTPVLVDFWAPWCGPCRAVAPVVEAVAAEYRGRVTVGKVNIDDNPLISATYRIQSIPTLLVFSGGRVVDTLVGAVPKARVARILDKYVDAPGIAS